METYKHNFQSMLNTGVNRESPRLWHMFTRVTVEWNESSLPKRYWST